MRTVIATLVVIGVIIGIFALSNGPNLSSPQATTGPPAEAPGYAARDAQVVETGEDGRPLYTLNAEQVRQHPDDNRIQLDAPRLVYIASDGTPWHAQARSGQIRDDGVLVELFGDVHLNGQPAGTTSAAVVDTSILSFDTHAEVASTHAPVTSDWNGQKLSGVGLTVNLNDGSLKLESRVHGRFNQK